MMCKLMAIMNLKPARYFDILLPIIFANDQVANKLIVSRKLNLIIILLINCVY